MIKLNKKVGELLNNEKEFESTAKNAFFSLDNNKNGLLDFEEVESLLHSFSKQNNLPKPSKKEVESVFISLDTNKDGKINYEEFKQFFKQYLVSLK